MKTKNIVYLILTLIVVVIIAMWLPSLFMIIFNIGIVITMILVASAAIFIYKFIKNLKNNKNNERN